jgi:dipeptidyl aminopeptidase/acylaminoacyl peptidase
MDPDGSNVRLLTDNTVADVDPAWSPDGTRLSFDSLRDSSSLEIYTMRSLDGTDVRRLTFSPAEDRRTSWSPDGSIAFQTGRDANFNIYRMNGTDGSDQRPLTADPTQDTQPAWSPDGTKIAYRSGREGNVGGDIFTMDSDVGETKDLQNVTNSPGVGEFAPHFSPDSRQIAFQATQADGTLAIFRMNADGTGPATFLTTVTDRPSRERFSNNESNPAWSPDGTRIVFHSDRDRDPSSTDPGLRDNVEVYTMNASDGSDVRRLTNSPGFDGRCDWERLTPVAAVPPSGEPPRPPVGGPPPTAARVRPNLFRPRGSARQSGRKIVVRVRGRMGGNQGRSCAGRLKMGIRFGKSRRVTRVARMGANCRYAKRVVFPVRRLPRASRARNKPVILRVAVRFQGNARLLSDVSPTRRIKVRR